MEQANKPKPSGRAQSIESALRTSSISTRIQLTQDSPLCLTLCGDFRSQCATLVANLANISWIRSHGNAEKTEKAQVMFYKFLKGFRTYRSVVAQKLKSYKDYKKPHEPEFSTKDVLEEMYGNNPRAQRLERLALQVRTTAGKDGQIDFARLKEIVSEMFSYFENSYLPDWRPALDRAFAPFLPSG